MDLLDVFLPVILYVSAIILLIVLIVMVIKIIQILDKVDRLVDNVEDKVNSFNGAINVLSKTANGFANISDSVVFGVSSFVSRLFNKYKKNKEDIYE